MLEVVEHEQGRVGAQARGDRVEVGPCALVQPERTRDHGQDARGVGLVRQRHEGRPSREALARGVRRLEREPALADAAGTDERHEPRLRAREQGRELAQLRCAADRVRRRRGQPDRARRLALGSGQVERRVVLQDRALELAQLGRGDDAEPLVEQAVALAVQLERLGLPPGAVEREHQLAAGALAQRLGRDVRGERGDHVLVPSQRELGLEPLLEAAEPELVEPARLLLERLAAHAREARAAPQPERLAEQVAGERRRRARERGAPARHELLEARGVERALGHAHRVAALAGLDARRRQHAP